MKIIAVLLSLAAAASVYAADGRVELINAKWGAGEKQCDATAFVAGRLREGKFLVLSPQNIGSLGDPAPMMPKELTANVKIQGQERTLTVGEYWAPIVIRTGDYPTTKDLTVYSATYGTGTEAKDLLDAVKLLVKENKTKEVDNNFAQTDPAPNKAKELIVFYSIGNCFRAMIVPEGKIFDPAGLK